MLRAHRSFFAGPPGRTRPALSVRPFAFSVGAAWFLFSALTSCAARAPWPRSLPPSAQSPSNEVPPITTIFTHNTSLLSLETLRAIVHKHVPEALVEFLPPTKDGEVPLVIEFKGVQLQGILGYHGDFSDYRSLALKRPRAACAQRREYLAECLDSIAAIERNTRSMIWIRALSTQDPQQRARRIIRALAKHVQGTIYVPVAFYDSSGNYLHFSSGESRF